MLLHRLSVKGAITGGFGVLLAIIVSGTAVVLYGVDNVSGTVDEVLERNRSATLLLDLDSQVKRAAGALSTYLLNKEESARSDYLAALGDIGRRLDTLQTDGGGADPAAIAAIRDEVGRFVATRERMLALAVDNDANYPGLRYATEHLNPVTVSILLNLDEIIRSADELMGQGSGEQVAIGSAARDMRYVWANVANDIRGYLSFRNKAVLANLELLRERFAAGLNTLEAHAGAFSFEQESAVAELATLVERFFSLLPAMIDLHGNDRWRTDAWVLRTEIGPLLASLEGRIREQARAQTAEAEGVSTELVSSLEVMGPGLSLLAVLGFLLGVGVARLTGSRIMGMIGDIRTAVDSVVQGDLTYRMMHGGVGEGREIAGLFNHLVENLQQVIANVYHAVGDVRSCVAKNVEVSERATESTLRQREELAGIAGAMEEVSSTFEAITARTRRAADDARQARQAATDGARLADGATEAMRQLAAEVERVAQVIAGLNDQTGAISSVLGVIDAISEQTNLLALNAAIEAARAGDHGRGFAVVADEVRTLAIRTQGATDEIQQIIRKLQDGSTGAVAAITEASRKADASAGQVREVVTALQGIAAVVATISELNDQIAGETDQQLRLVGDLSRRVESISGMAHETAEGARHTAESGNRLSVLAQDLHVAVSSFRA